MKSLLLAVLIVPFTLAVPLSDSGTTLTASAAEPQFYDPIERDVEGWTIKVDPALLEGEEKETGEKCLLALANHLQRIKFILDKERVASLQKRPIWIEKNKIFANEKASPSCNPYIIKASEVKK